MVLTDEQKKEKRRIIDKKYRDNNKEKIKQYYEKNKEKINERNKKYREDKKEYDKKYHEDNKEKIREKAKERGKEYREKNKEKIREKDKKYNRTPEGIKSRITRRWKGLGLIYEDYDSLYGHYLNANNCDECGIKFGKFGGGMSDWKCMDHCHETGAFRNFLCCKCNLRRG